MWGNHIADRVAAGDVGFISKYSIQVTEVHYSHLLNELGRVQGWHWTKEKQLITERPQELIDRHRHAAYLLKRDGYREENGENRCWEHSTTAFSAKIFNVCKSLKSRVVGQRLGLMKGWFGANRVKSAIPDDEDDFQETLKCELCTCDDT